MLIVFAGLPGVGKSTIARLLAHELGAVWLRADTIEQALRDYGLSNDQIGGMGYGVACRIATENLKLGRVVIADMVNPWELTRDMWHRAATDAGSPFFDVEIVCSNAAEHERRVRTRQSDIEGHVYPTWEEVVARDYHAWKSPALTIDTDTTSPAEAVSQLLGALHPLA